MTARDAATERFYPWWGMYRRDVLRQAELSPVDIRAAYLAGWYGGAAYALRTSAKIADLVPVLDLFCDLLAAELDERIREADPVIETGPAFAAPPSGGKDASTV